MLARAAKYMYANEEELVIRIGGTTITPFSLVGRFRMNQTLFDMAAYPRLLLGDEEVALHGLAGGLDSMIDVYDVTANEIVTFGAAASPSSARWIVRYPNGTYGVCLLESIDH